MWAKPRVESLDNIVKRVYKVLEALKEYGSEFAPNYLPARRKRDVTAFSLEEQSIRELLRKNTNKEGNKEFPDLGCTIGFFSSMDDDESCDISMTVGVSNQKFNNALVIHFPLTFSINKQNVIELEELFKNIIRIFEPYWACIANNKNIKMFDGKYWIYDKPSTMHWLNYFGGDVAQKLGIQKIKEGNFASLEEVLDGYVLKLQDEPLNVGDKSHMERQRKMNEHLGLI